MLIPSCKVKLSTYDYLMILGPTLFGVASAIYHLAFGHLNFSTITSAATTLSLVMAPLYAGLEGYLGFKKKEKEYEQQKSVYMMYHLCDNNAGVLSSMLEGASNQDANEALLAYWWACEGAEIPKQVPVLDLDNNIKAYLQEIVPYKVTFNTDEALRQLVKMGIAEIIDMEDGSTRVKVKGFSEVLEVFDTWDPNKSSMISWVPLTSSIMRT